MATTRPRLSSTTPHAEAGQQQDVDLGSKQRRYVGHGLHTDRNVSPIAEHRGSHPSLSRKLTGTRWSTVKSIVEWTRDDHLYLSPGTHACPECGVRYDQPLSE
jgi:hypothetical protein